MTLWSKSSLIELCCIWEMPPSFYWQNSVSSYLRLKPVSFLMMSCITLSSWFLTLPLIKTCVSSNIESGLFTNMTCLRVLCHFDKPPSWMTWSRYGNMFTLTRSMFLLTWSIIGNSRSSFEDLLSLLGTFKLLSCMSIVLKVPVLRWLLRVVFNWFTMFCLSCIFDFKFI